MFIWFTGAQSEDLRLAGQELTGRVWGEVAHCVLEAVQPVTVDSWAVTELVPSLEALHRDQGVCRQYCGQIDLS